MEPNELNKMTAKHDLQALSCSKAKEEDPWASSHSHCSLSAPTNLSSSPKIKQRLQSETKRKMAAKKPKYVKSKAKQVVSDGSTKLERKKRVRIDDLYDNLEAKFNVMERAGGLLVSLATDVPTFVKCMLPSNVAYGFWLILPKKFCSLHLPGHDTMVIFVDECGSEHKTKYLFDRHGLSAGWRGFALAHRLHKGDILVFNLIGPCKLKVHIVRVYGLEEFDAALCLMNLDTCGKISLSDHKEKEKRTHKKAKCEEPIDQERDGRTNMKSKKCAQALHTEKDKTAHKKSKKQVEPLCVEKDTIVHKKANMCAEPRHYEKDKRAHKKAKKSAELLHAEKDNRVPKKAKQHAELHPSDNPQPQGHLHKNGKEISNCYGFVADESVTQKFWKSLKSQTYFMPMRVSSVEVLTHKIIFSRVLILGSW